MGKPVLCLYRAEAQGRFSAPRHLLFAYIDMGDCSPDQYDAKG